jgi:hypothetical protein
MYRGFLFFCFSKILFLVNEKIPFEEGKYSGPKAGRSSKFSKKNRVTHKYTFRSLTESQKRFFLNIAQKCLHRLQRSIYKF